MKACSACGAQHYCKGLCYEHYRSAYREKNRQLLRLKQAAYYVANKEKAVASAAAWRSRNPGWGAAHHQKNKTQRNAQIAAWAAANPEAKRASVTNRRARLRNAVGSHSAAEVKALFYRQRGRCAVCAAELPKSYHKDHIQSVSSGGSNFIENIQLLCPACNTSKQHKDPVVFMQSRGFLL